MESVNDCLLDNSHINSFSHDYVNYNITFQYGKLVLQYVSRAVFSFPEKLIYRFSVAVFHNRSLFLNIKQIWNIDEFTLWNELLKQIKLLRSIL